MDVLEYLARGRAALKDGEFELAERYFRQVIEYNPDNADAHNGLQSLTVERAKKNWSPISWSYRLVVGALLIAMGKAPKAYEALQLAHLTRPDNRIAALIFARCAAASERLDEARAIYTQLLRRNPSDVAALKADADLLERMEEYEEAAERLKRLHAMRPNDDKLERRLRDISALSYSRTGIPKNLTERRAQMEREKLESLDEPEFMDALEQMQSEYERNPGDHGLGVRLAAHYRQGKHNEHAARVLASILDEHPEFEPARREQARVWRLTGELTLAAHLFEELHNQHPQDRELKDETLEAKIAVLKAGGDSGGAFGEIESLRIEREKNRIEWLQEILETHPESCAERAELGELLLKHGRVDEAIGVVQRLFQEPSWAGRGFYLLGQCFRAKGDRALAAQQFEKSLEFFRNRGYSHVPSDELKAVYYYLGVVREEMGDIAKAREAYGEIYSFDINYRDVKDRYERSFAAPDSAKPS